MSEKKKIDGRSAEARQLALAKGDDIQDMYLSPNRQCSAMSKIHGRQCHNRAMVGQRTCRMHGGATRKARTAATKRVAEASGFAADLLVELMADPDTDKVLRTRIAQDLLDRNGVVAKRLLELTVEKGRSFEDVTADVFMDLTDLDDDTNDIIDAEVVEPDYEEDDADRWSREDNQHERAKEIERMKRGAPTATPDLNALRARQEADLIRRHESGDLGEDDLSPQQAQRETKLSREQLLMERIPGATGSGRRRTMSPKRYEQRQRE